MSRKKILSQMFDVRPVAKTGYLDWEKIRKVKRVTIIEEVASLPLSAEKKYTTKSNNIDKSIKFIRDSYDETTDYENKLKEKKTFLENHPIEKKAEKNIYELEFFEQVNNAKNQTRQEYFFTDEELRVKENDDFLKKFRFADIFLSVREIWNFSFRKTMLAFASMAMVILLLVSIVPIINFGQKTKSQVLGASFVGVQNMEKAVTNLKAQDFEASNVNFRLAYDKFNKASQDLGIFSSFIGDLSAYSPFTSKLASGKNAIQAGAHLAKAGENLSKTIQLIKDTENPFSENNNVSLLEIFFKSETELKEVLSELVEAEKAISKINIEDLPAEKREKFMEVKKTLPEIISLVRNFISNSDIFVEIFGGNGPRKYLFLFQNNQEMRPTGGFIGSYGVLDIKNGRIRNFFIDGIFNPSGQLKDKIVPPQPIQKISAAWNLHDSNWWPDFPKSAKKVISFYEKTGGPTVDGIIAVTPDVMEKFLEITGPIEMEDYAVTLNAENFVPMIQYEVEIDYDKEENRPKKILSDLAPIVLDRIFSAKSAEVIGKSIGVISEALAKKQIIFYSQDKKIQKLISDQGWSGEVLNSTKDYLMVVNTNINGYKTDGVIEESIDHQAEIYQDGTIVNTVTVTRVHNGGKSEYEWWNKVNANYMRVYVPQGSQLIDIEGQTREFTEAPLDYNALGFSRDIDVENEEKNMHVDTDRGVRIYDDSEKTVFAHWAYVSPGETVKIKYKYKLPFKINLFDKSQNSQSYSILYQKQSGSKGSRLKSTVVYPEKFVVSWKYPDSISQERNYLLYESIFETDKFLGVVFSK